MPSKDKRLTRTGIEAFEAKCDIGKELLQSILDMQAGKGQFGPGEMPTCRGILEVFEGLP